MALRVPSELNVIGFGAGKNEISSRMNDSYVESSIKHDYVASVVIKFWRAMNKRPGPSHRCLSQRPINSVVAAICWHKNQTLFSLRSWSLRLMLHFWFTASSTFSSHGEIGLEPYRFRFWLKFSSSCFCWNNLLPVATETTKWIRLRRTNWVDF
jgi:hypothetical protein